MIWTPLWGRYLPLSKSVTSLPRVAVGPLVVRNSHSLLDKNPWEQRFKSLILHSAGFEIFLVSSNFLMMFLFVMIEIKQNHCIDHEAHVAEWLRRCI